MRYGVTWLLAMLCLINSADAQLPGVAADEPTLIFLATDPAVESTLGRQEPFYVWFEVRSTQPVGIMLDAYYRGEPVLYGLGTSGTALLPAVGGGMVTSFFYWSDNRTPIDEVRLHVGDPKNTLSGKAFSLPVKLVWTGQPAASRELAPWLQEWLQSEDAHQQHKGGASDAASKALDTTFAAGMIAIALAGLGLPLWGALRWRSRWRVAALVLFTLPVGATIWILVAAQIAPASRWLSPREVALCLAFSTIAMGVLFGVRAWLRRRAAAPPLIK